MYPKGVTQAFVNARADSGDLYLELPEVLPSSRARPSGATAACRGAAGGSSPT